MDKIELNIAILKGKIEVYDELIATADFSLGNNGGLGLGQGTDVCKQWKELFIRDKYFCLEKIKLLESIG